LIESIPAPDSSHCFFISKRKQGGYALARAPEEISIRELLEALEGDLAPVSCLASDHLCELADGCTTRRIWEQIDQKIQEALESLSLGDILTYDLSRHSADKD
jgi:Rrf2 family cysteine metabolism transcriptional repressor